MTKNRILKIIIEELESDAQKTVDDIANAPNFDSNVDSVDNPKELAQVMMAFYNELVDGDDSIQGPDVLKKVFASMLKQIEQES